MNQCPNCDVWTKDGHCPLCGENLVEGGGAAWYPYYDPELQKKRTNISRLAILLGALAVFICLAINIIVIPQFLWVFYVAIGVFYVVVSLTHTILSASHIGGKITAQVVSLTLVLLVIDFLSGDFQWSVNYAVPFLIVAGILVISIIILTVRLKWTSYLSFLLIMIALGFLPLVFFLSGLADVLWPSIIAAVFAVTVFTLLLLFANRSFMTQLGRRFHL